MSDTPISESSHDELHTAEELEHDAVNLTDTQSIDTGETLTAKEDKVIVAIEKAQMESISEQPSVEPYIPQTRKIEEPLTAEAAHGPLSARPVHSRAPRVEKVPVQPLRQGAAYRDEELDDRIASDIHHHLEFDEAPTPEIPDLEEQHISWFAGTVDVLRGYFNALQAKRDKPSAHEPRKIGQPTRRNLMGLAVVVGVLVLGVTLVGAYQRGAFQGLIAPAKTSQQTSLPAESSTSSASQAASPMTTKTDLVVRERVEDYSFAELSLLSQEIAQASSEEKALDIAAQFHLCTADKTLDGTQTKTVICADGSTLEFMIAGFNQDTRADNDRRAGITFLAKTPLGSGRPLNAYAQTSGGWAGSTLKTWLAEEALTLLPADLTDRIVAVHKVSNPPIDSGTTNQSVQQEKLWIPSYSEIVGELTAASKRYHLYQPEGDQYRLFAQNKVRWDLASPLLARGYYWWLRTPDPTNSAWFMCIAPDGLPTYAHRPATDNQILIGFCL